MSYESLVLLAFIVWLCGLIWFFISINSQFERNLRKVSLRLSWLTLAPKAIDTELPEPSVTSKVLKFALIQGVGLLSVLLGPIYIAYAVGMIAFSLWKDAGAPASVKEIRWKLRNIDMSAEQVETLIKGHLIAMRQ